MRVADKKAPASEAEAYHSTIQPDQYITSQHGRRAIASLWNASRTVSGAALSQDDLSLIREALAEIAEVLQ